MRINQMLAFTTLLILTRMANAFEPTPACDRCSLCERHCNLTVNQSETQQKCFDVKQVDVCIPPVRFWWQKGPVVSCGRTRTVNRLVTESRTTSTCEYHWDVVTVCRQCFQQIHRVRCQEMGVSTNASAQDVGLPDLPNDYEAVMWTRVPPAAELSLIDEAAGSSME